MADDAEKEASEVLHSLLGVERIKDRNFNKDGNNIILIASTEEITDGNSSYQPIKINEKNITSIQKDTNESDEETILDVELDTDVSISSDNVGQINSETEDEQHSPKKHKTETNKLPPGRKSIPNLEDSPLQVQEILKKGCECKDSCFIDLNAESVYRHRLNIADLTKEEHDMYLMGVTMASLANRKQTSRLKERIRQRASYVYQGRKVCLDAFVYLENVTHYHLKRIRFHVMKNGVTPRVHGNQGKKPHNTFSLDLYKSVEMFLKNYLSKNTDSSDLTKNIVIHGKSRTQIYNEYKLQFEHAEKIMAYTTFRHFMRKQFPNVRFTTKIENTKASASGGPASSKSNHRDKDFPGNKRFHQNSNKTNQVTLQLAEPSNSNHFETVSMGEQQILSFVDGSDILQTIILTADPETGQFTNVVN